MKRIFTWLERKLFRRETVADQPNNPESAKPGEIDLGLNLPKELQDLVEDVTIDLDVTVPNFEIAADTDKTTGFDPEDTATMHKK